MVRLTGFEPVLLALACALDDPLPYTFQSDGTPPSSDVFPFGASGTMTLRPAPRFAALYPV